MHFKLGGIAVFDINCCNLNRASSLELSELLINITDHLILSLIETIIIYFLKKEKKCGQYTPLFVFVFSRHEH